MGIIDNHMRTRATMGLLERIGKRWVWNIVIIAQFVFFIFIYIYSTIIICSGLFSYHVEQTFVRYSAEVLYTDEASFELKDEELKIHFSPENRKELRAGDRIGLKINKVTGQFMEITLEEKVLYQLYTIAPAIWLQQPIMLFILFFLGLGIYLLNAKNPKGWAKKNTN